MANTKKSFYVKTGDAVRGPFSGPQIRELASSGELQREHLVSSDQQKWVPAKAVKGLEFAAAQPPPVDDPLAALPEYPDFPAPPGDPLGGAPLNDPLRPLGNLGGDALAPLAETGAPLGEAGSPLGNAGGFDPLGGGPGQTATPAAAPAVPGRACPSCGAGMAANAILCVQCGFHTQRGQQVKTKSTGDELRIPISPEVRKALVVFAIFFTFIGSLMCLGLAAGEWIVGGIGMVIVVAGLAAIGMLFTAGRSYAIESGGGERTLEIGFRLFGTTVFSSRVPLSSYREVWFVQTAKAGDNTVLLVIMLFLLCFGVVPGLIWWVVLLRKPDASVNYRTELRGPKLPGKVVFRGGDWAKHDANDLARMLAAAGLSLEQDLGLVD